MAPPPAFILFRAQCSGSSSVVHCPSIGPAPVVAVVVSRARALLLSGVLAFWLARAIKSPGPRSPRQKSNPGSHVSNCRGSHPVTIVLGLLSMFSYWFLRLSRLQPSNVPTRALRVLPSASRVSFCPGHLRFDKSQQPKDSASGGPVRLWASTKATVPSVTRVALSIARVALSVKAMS